MKSLIVLALLLSCCVLDAQTLLEPAPQQPKQDVPAIGERHYLSVDLSNTLFGNCGCANGNGSVITTSLNQEVVPWFDLSASPNPAQSSTTVHVYNPSLAGSDIRSLAIYSMAGDKVRDLTDAMRGHMASARIDIDVNLSDLPIGIYLIYLEAGKKTRRAKIAIVR